MPEPQVITDADILAEINAMIQLRDYYHELMDHAEEITARVNRDTEMPDELKALIGEQP